MSNINFITIWTDIDATTSARVVMNFIKLQFSPSFKDGWYLFCCETGIKMMFIFLGIFQQCFDEILKLFVDLAYFNSPLTKKSAGA